MLATPALLLFLKFKKLTPTSEPVYLLIPPLGKCLLLSMPCSCPSEDCKCHLLQRGHPHHPIRNNPHLCMCDVQAGFRKGRGTRDQIANIRWIIEKAREFQKSIYFCFIDYAKAFDCVDHNKLWKILKEMGIPDHLTCLLRNCMQVRKQQLDLDMEQQTGSK